MILRGKPNDRAWARSLALKGPESASIFRRGSGDDVETGTTAHDLSRVISPEGQQLLQHHNLLRPLIEKMVIDETTSSKSACKASDSCCKVNSQVFNA